HPRGPAGRDVPHGTGGRRRAAVPHREPGGERPPGHRGPEPAGAAPLHPAAARRGLRGGRDAAALPGRVEPRVHASRAVARAQAHLVRSGAGRDGPGRASVPPALSSAPGDQPWLPWRHVTVPSTVASPMDASSKVISPSSAVMPFVEEDFSGSPWLSSFTIANSPGLTLTSGS